MALSPYAWHKLSTQEKDEVIDFLIGNCKIDHESPNGSPQFRGSYQISNGTTSTGNQMKYGEEYRIYVISLDNCPPFLANECKEGTSTYAARIGGNDAIKEIMSYGNLNIGRN